MRWLVASVLAGWVSTALVACGGGGSTSSPVQPPGDDPPGNPPPGDPPPGDPPPGNPPPAAPKAPVELGGFAFYAADQGLATVNDASADEGGNVYVAGGDKLYVRPSGARDFKAFTAEEAGLTANCWDEKEIANPKPPGAARTCPIISVGGAAAGKAAVGFKGVGTDYDFDAEWARNSGGADVISFDGTKVTRDRHVFIASPPGAVCEAWLPGTNNTVCDSRPGTETNQNYIGSTWVSGRYGKGRQIHRIVVNHDKSRPLSYGDILLGGSHAVISILVAHPKERGWLDYAKGDPRWAEAEGVWEHDHPAYTDGAGRFLSGNSQALAIDPRWNRPWFSNETRTSSMEAYGDRADAGGNPIRGQPRMRNPDWRMWWGDQSPASPHLALWGDSHDLAHWDVVTGISFCDDGTMWVASMKYGLKRRDLQGNWAQVAMPAATDQRASAVACDPVDESVWVGFDYGGFGRLKSGTWQAFVPEGAPSFAQNPVARIQIDRWSSPRAVLLVHQASRKVAQSGLTVYTGP